MTEPEPEPEPLLPPPHDLEAEEIVLSAALWGECGDALAHEVGLLPGTFWAPQHQQIWATLLTAEELLGDDVDWRTRCWLALTLVRGLTDRRLLEILRAATAWRSVEECAATIRRLARQRQLLEAMARIGAAWRRGEEPAPELLRWTARRLEGMLGGMR